MAYQNRMVQSNFGNNGYQRRPMPQRPCPAQPVPTCGCEREPVMESGCHEPHPVHEHRDWRKGVDEAPLAMAYVPYQTWNEVYEIEKGFQRGTIFPCLDKPFLGGCCNEKFR